jgi:hypothetical protein
MIVLTGSVNRRDAPGALCVPVLSAAFCRSMQAHLAAPGPRVSRDTYAPMPSRPRDGDELVAHDGVRALAAGAKVEWKPGQAATRPRATNVRVI